MVNPPNQRPQNNTPICETEGGQALIAWAEQHQRDYVRRNVIGCIAGSWVLSLIAAGITIIIIYWVYKKI